MNSYLLYGLCHEILCHQTPRFLIPVPFHLAPALISSEATKQCKSRLITREELHIFLQAARLDQGGQATPPQTTNWDARAPGLFNIRRQALNNRSACEYIGWMMYSALPNFQESDWVGIVSVP